MLLERWIPTCDDTDNLCLNGLYSYCNNAVGALYGMHVVMALTMFTRIDYTVVIYSQNTTFALGN